MLPYLLTVSFLVSLVTSKSSTFPNTKVYGVNIGNWLIFEPWMAENEWVSMGGGNCSSCSQCIATESSLVQANPNGADALFNKHWTSWFTQSDVNQMKSAGLNTARIPIGWWIVESLVNRNSEHFPRGGISQLKRGAQMLKNAGIQVILDLHAAPGAQVPGNAFTGVCASSPQFYNDANYARALRWTVVMTVLAHLDSDFGSAFAIEAVNEPNMDANTTPGYGTYQTNFVQVVRGVELALGMSVPGFNALSGIQTSRNNLNTTLITASQDGQFSSATQAALRAGLQDLQSLASAYGLGSVFTYNKLPTNLLYTNFMDVNWQFNNPPNPSSVAHGNQVYDNHLYYSFGGVADPNESAYLASICHLTRVQNDAGVGNSPLWFGEWSLATQFTASDAFNKQWADAQKLAYSQGAGWIFWNFKMESSSYSNQWSYFEGLQRGYLTSNPAAFNNPSVCNGH